MLYSDNLKAIFLPVQCSQSNDFMYVLINKYEFKPYEIYKYLNKFPNGITDPSLLTMDKVISSDEKLKEYTIFSCIDDIYNQFICNFNAVKRIYEVDKDNYESDNINNTHTQKFPKVIFEGVSSVANITLDSFVANISNYNNNILNDYFKTQSEKICYGNDISIKILKVSEWRSQLPIFLNTLDTNLSISTIDELNPTANEPVVTLEKPFYEYYDQTILDFVNQKYSVDFVNFGVSPLPTMEEFNKFYSST
jgi:hypothetical protein